MIPNDQPARKQMIERMITTLTANESNLTKWELIFLGSVSNQFNKKGDLSDKQCEILEQIYDK